MGLGSVNVPGVTALTTPWENTDIWRGLSDHKNADSYAGEPYPLEQVGRGRGD